MTEQAVGVGRRDLIFLQSGPERENLNIDEAQALISSIFFEGIT